MDEDLPSPLTDYNPGGHTTNALKTSLPTLYTHSFDTRQLYVQVPRITICLHAQKTLYAVQVACHSIFGQTLTDEI
jgi:hypothetical protein